MDPLTIAAASGIRSRMQSMDLLANNIANAGTSGYKSDREFYSLYLSAESTPEEGALDSTQPVIQKQWTDFTPGELQVTGSPLNIAVTGKGFFAVNGPNGPLY